MAKQYLKMDNNKREKKLNINSSFSIVNLLDELDWTIGGYGRPTPQFAHNLNVFVESYILNESFYLHPQDFFHIRWTRPFFPDGRPIFEILLHDDMLYAAGKIHDQLIAKDDVGKVIYISDKSKNNNGRDFWDEYTNNVKKEYIKEVIPNIPIGMFPYKLPILMQYQKKVGKKTCYSIINFQRSTKILINNILRNSFLTPVFPIYAERKQFDFFSNLIAQQNLYKKLAQIHNTQVNEILNNVGYKSIEIPPLTSILLSRCKKAEDIPERLSKMRVEFTNLRKINSKHQLDLINAQCLKEQFEIIKEYEFFWDTFKNKLKRTKKRIVFRIWDVLKEGKPDKWFTKSIDKLAEWQEQKNILNRFKPIVEIWDLVTKTPNIIEQISKIEKLFGQTLDPNDWNEYELYIADSKK